MSGQMDFIKFLEQQRDRYIDILEELFGPRDQRFVLGSIGETPYRADMPQTYFPNGFDLNGGCIVDIHISRLPWRTNARVQGTWQVAHECVHLLDPGEPRTNYLEKGLATWFQCESKYHVDEVKGYIERKVRDYFESSPADMKKYIQARDLVCYCMPGLSHSVREIRGSGIRIRDVTVEVLASCLPEIDREMLHNLCAKFDD